MRNHSNRMRRLILRFQNPCRAMRASTWNVTDGHWRTRRIKKAYMLDEEVWS